MKNTKKYSEHVNKMKMMKHMMKNHDKTSITILIIINVVEVIE